jgi:hypothetical protein
VAMPQERLQLLVESAAQLRDLVAAMDVRRSETGTLASVRALRNELADRKKLARADLDNIVRTLSSIANSRSYPERFKSIDDLVRAEYGPFAALFELFGNGQLLLSRLYQPVGEEKIELQKVASALEASNQEPGTAQALAEIRQFLDLVDAEKASIGELGSRLAAFSGRVNSVNATRKDLVGKRTGAAAAAYLDAVIAITDSYTSQIEQFIQHAQLYVRMLELTLTANGNPVVLEMRLGPR